MDKTVGVLGGGQLGRMLTEAANRLNIRVATLETSPTAPAKQVAAHDQHVIGSFTDAPAVQKLADQVDVLTVEIEHVDTQILETIAQTSSDAHDLEGNASGPDGAPRPSKRRRCQVQPSWRTIRTIQDKYAQKLHLEERGIACAQAVPVDTNASPDAIDRTIREQLGGYPAMLKARTGAYDGKGNYPLQSQADIRQGLEALRPQPLYLEAWADFALELAVMVVKTKDASETRDWSTNTQAFPVAETIHQDSICKLVYVPARGVSASPLQQAQDLARRAVASFWGKGIFGVEMFLLKDGRILINEIAPRPHNSGHYTIEACAMSQYEAHLRAILDLPIPLESLQADRTAIMLNILGGAEPDTHHRVAQLALSVPRAAIHLYGKGAGKPGRKMGHVTVTAANMADAERSIAPLISLVDTIRHERLSPQEASSTAIQSQPHPTRDGIQAEEPVVAVTMGSDSDLKTLRPGIELLKHFGIPHRVTITSAHRTPARMFEFAEHAAAQGIKVIIAAAGGAAHLPGMVAAISRLPVIGVPVQASVLDGQDSLYSIVQMPRGCPVATVAINNSNNAAQLAIRILALNDRKIAQRLEKYLSEQTQTVLEKASKLEAVGLDNYTTT